MALGITPKHNEDFAFRDLSLEQFLALASETAKKLNWKITYLNRTGLIAHTDKGMFSWNAEIKIKIEEGIANIQSISTGNEMFDWGKNKKTVKTFLLSLEQVRSTMTLVELNSVFQKLNDQFVTPEEDILKLPPVTRAQEIKELFTIFKPVKGFFVTPILIDLNILIFIVMALNGANIVQPDNETLLSWGANFKPLTLEGEWWRLITNCFLHIGILHLLMNMYALLFIGVLLEPHLGRTRFAAAYLLAGFAASVASLWWHTLTISAGASGAIFGMYGVFLAMLTTNLIEKSIRKSLLTSISIFIGYNLLLGFDEGIDNAAHLGGLLVGVVIGYSLIPSLKKPFAANLKFGTVGLLSILIIALSGVVYKNQTNDIGTYEAKMKEFFSMESMALEVYSLPKDTPQDQILKEIKNRGLYYWKENIKLLDSFKEMNLPLEIIDRNQLLHEYCELRVKSYELIYASISEGTESYREQIEDYNKQIEAKIKELGGGQ